MQQITAASHTAKFTEWLIMICENAERFSTLLKGRSRSMRGETRRRGKRKSKMEPRAQGGAVAAREAVVVVTRARSIPPWTRQERRK